MVSIRTWEHGMLDMVCLSPPSFSHLLSCLIAEWVQRSYQLARTTNTLSNGIVLSDKCQKCGFKGIRINTSGSLRQPRSLDYNGFPFQQIHIQNRQLVSDWGWDTKPDTHTEPRKGNGFHSLNKVSMSLYCCSWPGGSFESLLVYYT